MRVAALVKTPLKPAGVRRLARAVLEAERAAVVALSFTFVGPRRMRVLNRTHLGHDYATDVIAFAMTATNTATARSRLPIVGDVYICPSVAARNAGRHAISPKQELRRLVIHGTLHVLGHEHPGGNGRTAGPMWRRQERYLTRFGKLAA